MKNEKVYTRSEVIKEIRNTGIKNFHTHNLKALERVLENTFENRTDEYLNRVYLKDDIEKLITILQLKDQGHNYAAIKTMLEATVTEQQIACTSESLQRVDEKNILFSDTMFDNFKSAVSEIVRESMTETISPHLIDMKEELINLKEQNQKLKSVLEKQQEEHFKQIDYKISRWRAEQAFKREKRPWYKTLFS